MRYIVLLGRIINITSLIYYYEYLKKKLFIYKRGIASYFPTYDCL
jgi:hypothetical protein